MNCNSEIHDKMITMEYVIDSSKKLALNSVHVVINNL